MPDVSTENNAPTPKALWIWDNRSRCSLPPALMAWLGLLVATCLCSIFFLREHIAARWVLGGFIASHAIVFGLPWVSSLVIRRGFVSTMHILCWAPGLVATMIALQGHDLESTYLVWSYCLIFVTSISFLFDFRDAGTYLYYVSTRKLQANVINSDTSE